MQSYLLHQVVMNTNQSRTITAGNPSDRGEPSEYISTKRFPRRIWVKIYEALGREAKGRVAVKLSTGEPGGHNFLQPALIKELVQIVNGTIVECNTAYGGGHANTESHLKAAADHGFTAIATVDIMDAGRRKRSFQ